MKVLILCGGYGARLAGVGVDVPKPMVPIGGKPMVWHIMKGFAHWGFDDFVLCLGYRSDLFRQYFLNLSMMVEDVTLDLSSAAPPVLHDSGNRLDWKITLAEHGTRQHDGASRQARRQIRSGRRRPVRGTYGDGVCDVDFREVVTFPPRARQARDGDRRASAGPFRRAVDGPPRRGPRVQREAASRVGVDQRRLLRVLASRPGSAAGRSVA